MNERIQQLKVQCWESKQYGPPWFNSTKFAELMVKEFFYCVEIMEKIAHASNASIPPDYDKHTYLETLETIRSLTKAHFGIDQ